MITLNVKPIETEITIDVGVVTQGGGALPYYRGDYEVTPKITEQTLPTKQKSMSDDVTIKPIPTNEVSNPYGITFTIGGE